jgi:hypothetical protein
MKAVSAKDAACRSRGGTWEELRLRKLHRDTNTGALYIHTISSHASYPNVATLEQISFEFSSLTIKT